MSGSGTAEDGTYAQECLAWYGGGYNLCYGNAATATQFVFDAASGHIYSINGGILTVPSSEGWVYVDTTTTTVDYPLVCTIDGGINCAVPSWAHYYPAGTPNVFCYYDSDASLNWAVKTQKPKSCHTFGSVIATNLGQTDHLPASKAGAPQ